MKFIEYKLSSAQVYIILQALQLYAFNFHNTWSLDINSEENEVKNSLIFHTYQYFISSSDYTLPTYDVLKSCRLNLRRFKLRQYKNIKKNKKIA